MKTQIIKKILNNAIAIFLLLLASLLLFPLKKNMAYSAQSKIPFEKCNYQRKATTERIVEESKVITTEACVTCAEGVSNQTNKKTNNNFLDSLVKAVKDKGSSLKIDPICFYASALKTISKKGSTSKKNYFHCKSARSSTNLSVFKAINPAGKTKKLYPRRVCLSKDYINMTAKAFNSISNCFDFTSAEDKKQLFALYNHESSFILNNRSHTGAKCYGQLTKVAIKAVDNSIRGKGYKRRIYDEFIDRCPNVAAQIILPKDKKSPYTCRTTQHPQTCFFYSMYFIKLNQVALDKTLNSVTKNISQNIEIDQKTKNRLKLPIKANEVLFVKGTRVKKNGKTNEVSWILPNVGEAYNAMKDVDYEKSSLTIEKRTIFETSDKLKWYILHSSYNGGGSVASGQFRRYLRNIKIQIQRSCSTATAKQERCKNRASIKSNKSLDYKYITKGFKKHLRSKYSRSKARRKEVSSFYGKIQRDRNSIADGSGDYLIDHLIAMQKENKNTSENTRKNAEAFQKQVGKQCGNIK